MAGIDLHDTEAEIEGAKWGIRVIPLLKFEELSDAIHDKWGPYRQHLQRHVGPDGKLDFDPDCAECTALGDQANRACRPVYREIVRWGIGSTTAPAVALKTESIQLDGRTYEVLTADVVEGLARIEKGAFVRALADRVLAANQLTPKEALGFG